MLLNCYMQYVSILENSAVVTRLEKFIFYSNPKEGNAPNVQINIQLHSFHMQARLCSTSFKLDFSSTMNQELSDEQTGFLSIRGTGGQIANIHWIMEKSV